MADMIVIDEPNQDTYSRKAGVYLYQETQVWLENDRVHREDGPAVISPDGSVRWYINGSDITVLVWEFFKEQGWAHKKGLDDESKRAAFKSKFLATV